MATEIKAIQCPLCGSTASKELRRDHYRCESCGTEYFIDNGIVNTRIKPGPGAPGAPGLPPQAGKGKSMLGCLVTIFVVVVIISIALIFGVATSSINSNKSGSGSGDAVMPTTWQYADS